MKYKFYFYSHSRRFDGRAKALVVCYHSIDHPLINLKSNYTVVKTGEKWIGQRFGEIAVEVLPLIPAKKLENRKLEAYSFCSRFFLFFSPFFLTVRSLTHFRDCQRKFMRHEKQAKTCKTRSTFAYEYVGKIRRKIWVILIMLLYWHLLNLNKIIWICYGLHPHLNILLKYDRI